MGSEQVFLRSNWAADDRRDPYCWRSSRSRGMSRSFSNEVRGSFKFCKRANFARCLTIACRKQVNKENCPASFMRFIALSATAPNIPEIGKWLRARTFVFGDEYRPVPLQCHVLGYPMPST